MNLAKWFGFVLGIIALVSCQSTAGGTPSAKMTHGPIAGAVTASSANIWVRTNQAAHVQIAYSTDSSLQNSKTTDAQTTDVDSDFTTIVKIPNLAPQQSYYYKVLVNDTAQSTAPYPQFQTFAPQGNMAPFRFVLLTDFRTVSKITRNVDTFKHAAAENPNFVILGGDMDHRNPTTLEEKREMFREVYTPAQGMEDFVNLVLHKFSVIHFWDDHDFGENNSDKTYPHKADSLRALQEYFPLYPITKYGDWQSFSYGAADFFVLDSRMQRDSAHEPDGPDKSMLDGDNLGDAGQRAWLLQGLKQSSAKWKFILSPVIFNPTTKNNDAWGAYSNERQLILDFIHSNNITGVIVLSGDLHMGAIDDGTYSGLPELLAPAANDGFDKRCLTDASGNVGKWSVGNFGDGNSNACNGYAVIDVAQDSVVLQVLDSQGQKRLSYTVR